MRKTQVALAALALMASTAALATEVKLSGVIDLGIANTSKDVNGAGGTFLEQGNLTDHSSIELDASEDLGGGMKAYLSLGMGFDGNGYNDNGGTAQGYATHTSLFNRQSYLGLSGDFGSLQAGKQLSPFILSGVQASGGVGSFYVPRLLMGNYNAAAALAAMGSGTNAAGFFVTNALQYISPAINGFTLRALVTTANGTHNNSLNRDYLTYSGTGPGSNPSTGSNKYQAYSLSGSIGPAFLTAAYQRRGDTDAGYAGNATDSFGAAGNKSWLVGGTMPLGETGFGISGGYMNSKVTNTDAVKSYNLGVDYAISGATKAILQYATSDQFDDKQTLTNFTVTHALSKSTTTYVTWARGTNGIISSLGNFKSSTAPTTFDRSNTSLIVGVAKSF